MWGNRTNSDIGGGGVYVVRTSGSAYCNKKKFYSGPTLDCLLYVLHMFCSTSYSQLESILHFHTERSLNGSQYKIGGRPRGGGRGSLNMDNTRQRGEGDRKIQCLAGRPLWMAPQGFECESLL